MDRADAMLILYRYADTMSLSLTLCRKALELSGTERSAAIDITAKCPPSTPSTPSVQKSLITLNTFYADKIAFCTYF